MARLPVGEHQSCDEGILQCLKMKMTIIIKIPQSSPLGEVGQREDNFGVTVNKMSVKICKT